MIWNPYCWPLLYIAWISGWQNVMSGRYWETLTPEAFSPYPTASQQTTSGKGSIDQS